MQIGGLPAGWHRAIMFKADLNAYLERMPSGFPVRSLAELIHFNEAHADAELETPASTPPAPRASTPC